MFENILIVCAGNICRSPVGERLFQEYFPHKKICSAGIVTQKSQLIEHPADRTMELVALANGLDISRHSAQQLTAEMCQHNDLILVMERKHIDMVAQILPEARGKIILYANWLDIKDIPDPYKQGREAFEFVFKMLKGSAIEWKKKIA